MRWIGVDLDGTLLVTVFDPQEYPDSGGHEGKYHQRRESEYQHMLFDPDED